MLGRDDRDLPVCRLRRSLHRCEFGRSGGDPSLGGGERNAGRVVLLDHDFQLVGRVVDLLVQADDFDGFGTAPRTPPGRGDQDKSLSPERNRPLGLRRNARTWITARWINPHRFGVTGNGQSKYRFRPPPGPTDLPRRPPVGPSLRIAFASGSSSGSARQHERAPVHRRHPWRAQLDACPYCLGGVHVYGLHEPVRLVRPDRQQCHVDARVCAAISPNHFPYPVSPAK